MLIFLRGDGVGLANGFAALCCGGVEYGARMAPRGRRALGTFGQRRAARTGGGEASTTSAASFATTRAGFVGPCWLSSRRPFRLSTWLQLSQSWSVASVYMR